MLQRMEARERDRLADEERRHQLELEEQRKRKVRNQRHVTMPQRHVTMPVVPHML